MNGLIKTDKKYQFYYDETNNTRMFKLTEDGFNDDDSAYFILGGVVFDKENEITNESLDGLYNDLCVPKNLAEVKFKFIKRKSKSFIELLSKKSVQIFVEWLEKHNCWIHYSYQDNLYFSLVDIVDSMDESHLFPKTLKNTLYECVKKDKAYFLGVLYQHNYPNITDQKSFVSDIVSGIENVGNDDDFYLEYLRQSLKSYKHKELAFLQNNNDLVTIESYSGSYTNRIITFINGTHTFDQEETIEAYINQIPSIKIKGKKVQNYQFVNSKTCRLIQLSDWVVGIIRMWMSYMERLSIDELHVSLSLLNEPQRKTASQLQSIFNTSLEENFAFKHGSGSNDFELKINLFLEYEF